MPVRDIDEPVMSGTPGTRYRTLVARAISAVGMPKDREVDAHIDATKAETMNTI